MEKINKIFITGASGGIGSAICKKFEIEKYTLVLTASSDEKLSNLKKNYGRKPKEIFWVETYCYQKDQRCFYQIIGQPILDLLKGVSLQI